MDRGKIRDILATIREDHDLVDEQLVILRELERTVDQAEGEHLERALQMLRSASRFFQTRLFPHFEQEEHGLFLRLTVPIRTLTGGDDGASHGASATRGD